MRLILITIYFFLLVSCRPKNLEIQTDLKDSLLQKNVKNKVYPYMAWVGFRQDGNGARWANFKLGDSLNTVLKYVDLETSLFKLNYLRLKQPIIKKCLLGEVVIDVLATFNTDSTLDNFKVYWEYKGDRTKEARSEFGSIIFDYITPFLWEEGVSLNTPTDSCTITFTDGHVSEFHLDCSSFRWAATYECRMGNE
jgi:hypothetical protein